MGCDENGIIQGVKAKVVSDTGAFRLPRRPGARARLHARGRPLQLSKTSRSRVTAYYTNNPPAGAFRGFGVTQTCFATETLLNEMADMVGISPWEIRYRNAIRPGRGAAERPDRRLGDGPCRDARGRQARILTRPMKQGKPVGLACAMKNAGVGVGLPDWGRCKLDRGGRREGPYLCGRIVHRPGPRHRAGADDRARTRRCTRGDIVYERSNTWIAPDSGDTSGSRQTLVTGEACRRACLQLPRCAGGPLAERPHRAGVLRRIPRQDRHRSARTCRTPSRHVAYGYATQMCILDKKTGLRSSKMVAAHDVGKAINPLSCEGQIEGGVVMSMGYALTEKYRLTTASPRPEVHGMLGLFRASCPYRWASVPSHFGEVPTP